MIKMKRTMARPLEFIISGRIITQVLPDLTSGEYVVTPGDLDPLIVVFGDIPLQVVDIQKKLGPYSLKKVYDAGKPTPINEVMIKDIEYQLNRDRRLDDVNGLLISDYERVRKKILNKRRKIIAKREIEEIEYFLIEYALTDRMVLKGLAGGEMMG